MVSLEIDSEVLAGPGIVRNAFGEFRYNLLNRTSRSQLARIDQLSSKSTAICHIKLKSPTVLQCLPREDSISLALKPMQATGLGPFACGKESLLGLSAVNHQAPLWAAELAGTEIYCVSVRRSLLAKHAYDIVDTSVLEKMQFLTLDQDRSEMLLKKVKQLIRTTDSTQALDIRLTHLLLSICEIASHALPTPHQSTTEVLWATLRDTPPRLLTSELLQDSCQISESQLNHLFKRTTGLSTRQFIGSYRLNSVRQALWGEQESFSNCVQSFGYQSPDQLYRAYRRLFAEEPPLN
tara:strand:+ start:571 stop:1452 length:882 start_codon:yes stop_codon:yes gene_type:complete